MSTKYRIGIRKKIIFKKIMSTLPLCKQTSTAKNKSIYDLFNDILVI